MQIPIPIPGSVVKFSSSLEHSNALRQSGAHVAEGHQLSLKSLYPKTRLAFVLGPDLWVRFSVIMSDTLYRLNLTDVTLVDEDTNAMPLGKSIGNVVIQNGGEI